MFFRSGVIIVKEISLFLWFVIVKLVSEDFFFFIYIKKLLLKFFKINSNKSWDLVFFFVLNICVIIYFINKIYNVIRYYLLLNNYF